MHIEVVAAIIENNEKSSLPKENLMMSCLIGGSSLVER